MEVTKVFPPEVASATAGNTTAADPGPRPALDILPTPDRANIRPLDLSGALQIILTEVRAEMDLPLTAAVTYDPSAPPSPAQAARAIVEMFLEAAPQNLGDAPAWTGAMLRLEATFQSSIDRALGAVSSWRDVPPAVLDATREVRVLFFTVLNEDPTNPLWLRLEWVGLAPRLQRFWRRRRRARRRLSDPDYRSGNFDESDESD